MDFTSDNAAGVAPEIMAAIVAANQGTTASYGSDPWTKRLQQACSALFEREVDVYPVFTGTAANALSLASIAPAWGGIFCHPESHIQTDECGAPEMFSGGAKLLLVGGANAKIDLGVLKDAVAAASDRGVHSVHPSAISITQASEFGTVYTCAEIAAIAAIARANKMNLHMDGARFANAVATLGCSPAEMTWKAGVDLLSFGATKNGALGAEAIIVFNRVLGKDLEFRRKRAGHLSSKMRFVSAQLVAYLENDLWLSLARRSNGSAKRLADGVSRLGVKPAFPVEANEVFLPLPQHVIDALRQKGASFFPWAPIKDSQDILVRFVTSFATPESAVDDFLAALKPLLAKGH